MRHRRGTRLRARLCANDQGSFAGAGIHEADDDAPVGFRQNLRGNVALSQFIARRQRDAVALDAETAFENYGVAIAVVAFRIFVRFQNQHAATTVRRDGASELNFDITSVGLRIRHQRILASFRAGDHFKMERFAGHGVVNRFVAGHAPFADRIEKNLGPRRRGGNLIENLETGGVRCEQFVTGVLVGFRLAGRNHCSRRFLRTQRDADKSQQEPANRERGRLGHTALLLCGSIITDSGKGVNARLACGQQCDWRVVRYTTSAEVLCTKSPRSTTTGWGGRARSARPYWNRTATALSWIPAPARRWTH